MKIKFLAIVILLCSCSVLETQAGLPKKLKTPKSETPTTETKTIETQIFFAEMPSPHTYKVSSAAELSALKLHAGDVVTFANGTYTDQTLVLTGEGTETAPIILRGETGGQVIFTGNSNLQIGGKFLRVENLYFKDIPPLKSVSVIDFKVKNLFATDCKLYNCQISGNGLPKSYDPSVWVSLQGQRNTVEHCSFDTKNNMGQILVVLFATEKGATVEGPAAESAPSHKISNNYFHRENSNADTEGGDDSRQNGQETVRIGTGAFSEQDGNCVVENNTFYRCNGEAEVVSNKTWRNYYRNNLFLECKGALTVRQGDNCVVENNFFIGKGIEGTGGIRITGNNHIIRNNYFEGTGGEKYFAAICLIKGVKNTKPVPVYHYAPVFDVMIENNVLVNCNQGLNIAYGTSQNLGSKATFKNNIVYNDNKNSANAAIIYNPDINGFTPSNITWIDNTIYGGKYIKPAGIVLPAMAKKAPELPNVKAKWESIKENSGVDIEFNKCEIIIK